MLRHLYATLALGLAACGTTVPVISASSSKSQFEGAAYAGVTTEVAKATPGADLYRAFQQGATGFVTVNNVRGGVEELANGFCTRKGRVVRLVRETTSPALLLPGNFPRVEWLFECEEAPTTAAATPLPDRITQVERLKKLLDSGALTQAEFDQEKARLLGQPAR